MGARNLPLRWLFANQLVESWFHPQTNRDKKTCTEKYAKKNTGVCPKVFPQWLYIYIHILCAKIFSCFHLQKQRPRNFFHDRKIHPKHRTPEGWIPRFCKLLELRNLHSNLLILSDWGCRSLSRSSLNLQSDENIVNNHVPAPSLACQT